MTTRQSRYSPNGCAPRANRLAPTPAFEHGFGCGEKPVSTEIIETVLARQLAAVRLFLRGALDAERTRKLSEQMRDAGLPL